MEPEIRNAKAYKTAELIHYNDTTVETRKIMENANGGIFILAFKQGQKLNQHPAPAEVMVQAVGGKIEFTVDATPIVLYEGDFMLMPKGTLHSVKALTDAKVLLTKINS